MDEMHEIVDKETVAVAEVNIVLVGPVTPDMTTGQVGQLSDLFDQVGPLGSISEASVMLPHNLGLR